MNKLPLISFLLTVFVLPCFNQENTNNEHSVDESPTECANGITSFNTTCSIETLDSVIHFEFFEDSEAPNVSKRFFYFDQQGRLDSIVEQYKDLRYNYSSGYRIQYGYDAAGRVSEVIKTSANSSIPQLKIVIREAYQYEEGLFRRYSDIEWRTAYDTSSVDFHEEYLYDAYNHLVDYKMHVPPEINPDSATYNEIYHYDSIGFLTYERKDLSEAGISLNFTETEYRNIYKQDSLPRLIHFASRTNGRGGWEDVGEMRLFYDDLNRKNMQSKSRKSDTGEMYEKQLFSYDEASNIIKGVKYISSDSVEYQIADSILYYHTLSELIEEEAEEENTEEEEEAPEAPEELDFNLFPNPTDGILYVRSGVDSPSELRVIDAAGKVILRESLLNGVTEIDLSPYPDGFYIIMLSSSMGYQTGKVFKF